jgi:pimeloyl-ACP methyl ester carboxylesterase
MQIIDRGRGPALVLVPGVQGRWQWVEPAVDALAETFRVITFSLCDEPDWAGRSRPLATIDELSSQIGTALDTCGVDRAAICGISFGGLPALRFAARSPERTRALVLASVPGPSWHLRKSHEIYARYPRLFAPLFLATAPLRLAAEVNSAIRARRERWRFEREQLSLLVRAPLSPSRMAGRARLIAAANVAADCAAVKAPTLVICGESRLDHVVTVGGTLEYARLIQGARMACLEHTGHLGSITRPKAFAALISAFLTGAEADSPDRGSDAA